MTRTLREMILGALDDAGGQDYLAEQAHKNLQLSWRCSARCSRGTFTQVEDSGSDFGANATVWGLATHPADADRIVAFSRFGEVYVTEDAGASWRKIAREFGEIRAAVWVPN
jgi:hypothetical protein